MTINIQSPTHYDVLGVKPDASKEEITKAYRKAMRIAHPDTSGEAHSPLAILVGQAYAVLRDENQRAAYDQALAGPTEPSSSQPGWGTEEAWDDTPVSPQFDDTYDVPFADEGYPAPAPTPYFAPTTPVDVNKVSWLRGLVIHDDPVYTPGKRTVLNPILLSTLGLLLYVAIPQLAADSTNLRLIFGSFQLLGLLLLLPSAFGAQGRGGWVGFTVSGFILAGFFAGTAGSMNLGIYFAVTTLLMSAAALSWRKWRIGRGAGADDVVALSVVKDQRVFGDPGVGLYETINRFGADNVAKGVHGERLTADLLDHLMILPGVRIIHGLHFPGSQKADVDHAVICGNRVAFIDSKYWTGGDWSWDAPGVVVNRKTPGGPGYPRTTHFQNAVESFTRSLKGMEVRGWFIIHPNDGRPVATDNTKAFGQPRLANSEQALEEIGAWLLEGQPSVIDRRHMATLLRVKN